MANQFKPIVRGPQTGSPPSLEFVAVDRLQVDPDYQRAIDGPKSRRLIVSMVREWDWALCLPLMVSRRSDGSLWIIDGQHRHAGAVQRGDIPHLPCFVQPSLDPVLEAKAFVGLNTRRQALSQADLFAGLLAMSDEHAKATAALLEETGWRVVRSNATDGWKPGDLACAPMVAGLLKVNGPDPVRAALSALRWAYTDSVVTAPANLIQALVALLRPNGALHGLDPAVIATAIGQNPAGSWITRSGALRERDPSLTRIASIAKLIADQVDAIGAAPPAGQVRTRLLDPPPPAR